MEHIVHTDGAYCTYWWSILYILMGYIVHTDGVYCTYWCGILYTLMEYIVHTDGVYCTYWWSILYILMEYIVTTIGYLRWHCWGNVMLVDISVNRYITKYRCIRVWLIYTSIIQANHFVPVGRSFCTRSIDRFCIRGSSIST